MTAPAVADDVIGYQPAPALAGAIARRELSVSAVLETFLARIARINPAVNAIVTLDEPTARAQAARMDAAFDPRQRPLYGLPLAIKDLAQTSGLRTTFGSPIYRDFVPDVDELFVARLRAAGAIIIGKTNTPEFGAGSQTFNPVFGATRNPYDLERTCGGSSGGAAVALACGLVPLADGSDLGGSLRNPAAFCNVVGFRPSPGRVPVWPKQFSSDQLAVAGPMARSVADCAFMLSVIAGPDARVPISLMEPGSSFHVPLARDFKGVRVAWSPTLGRYEVDAQVREVLERALPEFAKLGITVEEATPDLADADEIFQVLRAWMFAARFGDELVQHRAHMKDTLVWNIEQGLKLTVPQISDAEIKRSRLIERVARFFERYDYLLCPSTQVAPFSLEHEWVTEINGRPMATYLDWMGVCYAITVTGCPALSVPAGFTADGLPVGLQIVGPRWRDFAVMQLGHAFEQATLHGLRRPPLVTRGLPDR